MNAVTIDPDDREQVGRFRDALDPSRTAFPLAKYQAALRGLSDQISAARGSCRAECTSAKADDRFDDMCDDHYDELA